MNINLYRDVKDNYKPLVIVVFAILIIDVFVLLFFNFDILVGFMIVSILIIIAYQSYRRRLCPQCHKVMMSNSQMISFIFSSINII